MNGRDQTNRSSRFVNETNYDQQYTQPDLAKRKRYVLEPYSPRNRDTYEYRTSFNTFRPITPPSFNQQFQDRQINTYNKQPQINLPTRDRRQQQQPQNKSFYQRDHGSSPTSEIGFIMDKIDNTKKSDKDLERGTQPKKSSRRHLLNNLFDFLAIAATCLVFGLIYLLIKPFQRGFYCDDTSIRYPYKRDTIPMWLLGIYGGLGPIIIFCIVEIWVVRPFHCGRGPSKNSLKQRQIDYLKTIFQTIFLFILGIAICFLITEVGKRTIGRLRPYYLTICNPIWSNIVCTKTVTTASGSLTVSQYITDHQCNSNASATDLQEAKLSFPSGHSSYSTYAFVFLFVYFEARLVCPNVQFLKPFLQCLCIAVAFFTCLSRVTDYKHHATDVIGGAIIGFCIAVFAAVRVGTYLWSFSVYCETEEETEKDRLPKEERISIPGVETKQTGALRSNEQIELETANPPYSTRSRNSSRSNYDNGVSIQQQKNVTHNMTNGGRRIAPGHAFDRIDN